jgi:hypothetical protein
LGAPWAGSLAKGGIEWFDSALRFSVKGPGVTRPLRLIEGFDQPFAFDVTNL